MKLVIGSDHAGFFIKQAIYNYLVKRGYEIKDLGTYNADESVDYPDFGHLIATELENGNSNLGIAVCGSGNGINMAANKHSIVRSALCWEPEIATLARQHNDANICALPGRFVSENKAIEIIEAFLSANFEGGRHQNRKEKISGKYC